MQLQNLDINEPTLLYHQKVSCRIDEESTPTLHETVENYYRVIYFEALDLIILCIEDRFN